MFILIYMLPFVGMLILCLLACNPKAKTEAYIFGLIAVFSILLGDWNNLTGAVFVCFAVWRFDDLKLILILFTLCVFAMCIKFTINPIKPINVIGYMYGHVYCCWIYFKMIHPGKHRSSYVSTEDMQIINLLLSGNKAKQIAFRVGKHESTVTKKLENLRQQFNSKTNEQLIYNLIKNRIIVLKSESS